MGDYKHTGAYHRFYPIWIRTAKQKRKYDKMHEKMNKEITLDIGDELTIKTDKHTYIVWFDMHNNLSMELTKWQ